MSIKLQKTRRKESNREGWEFGDIKHTEVNWCFSAYVSELKVS